MHVHGNSLLSSFLILSKDMRADTEPNTCALAGFHACTYSSPNQSAHAGKAWMFCSLCIGSLCSGTFCHSPSEYMDSAIILDSRKVFMTFHELACMREWWASYARPYAVTYAGGACTVLLIGHISDTLSKFIILMKASAVPKTDEINF